MLVLSLATAGVAAAATTPEFKPLPTKKKLTGSTSGVVWVFDNGAESMTCKASSTTGEITSASTIGKVDIVFTGCTTSGTGKSGCAVNSTGAKSGEIAVDGLDGELGTVASSEAPSGVAVLLEPENSGKTWTTLAGNECTRETKLTGRVAAAVGTIGKKQTTNTLTTITEVGGTVKLDSGKSKEITGLTAWGANITLQAQDEVKFEEALEVT